VLVGITTQYLRESYARGILHNETSVPSLREWGFTRLDFGARLGAKRLGQSDRGFQRVDSLDAVREITAVVELHLDEVSGRLNIVLEEED